MIVDGDFSSIAGTTAASLADCLEDDNATPSLTVPVEITVLEAPMTIVVCDNIVTLEDIDHDVGVTYRAQFVP